MSGLHKYKHYELVEATTNIFTGHFDTIDHERTLIEFAIKATLACSLNV